MLFSVPSTTEGSDRLRCFSSQKMEISLLRFPGHSPLFSSQLMRRPIASAPFSSRAKVKRTFSQTRQRSDLFCCCSGDVQFDWSLEESENHDAGCDRRWFVSSIVATVTALCISDVAEAVSTSKRALRASRIPEADFTTLPNGLKYFDLKVGSGAKAVKGSRVAVHYVARWKGITFMTSRQGLGVGGGTPYGFDVGQSERGSVMKGLDLGVEGMKVGGQRLLIVPPELAYGKKGVQEIPPNATIELDVELLAIKQSPFGIGVKIVEG